MKISFAPKPRTDTDLHLIAVPQGDLKKIAGPQAKAIKAILNANPDYKAEAGDIVVSVVPGFRFKRLGLLGLGDLKKERTQLGFEKIGGKLMAALITLPIADVYVDCTQAKILTPEEIAAMGSGAQLRAYEFKSYLTKNKDDVLPDTIVFTGDTVVQKAYAPMAKMASAVHWARDLVNEPPNVLFPESFAARVVEKLTPLGVKVSVMDDKTLEKKGFGAMIAVGKASENLPRLVIMEYKGAGASDAKPVALIGKGVTFDTGGYSIKTAEGMTDMKCDMAGAAAVAGAMMALAATKAPVHVVAALAMAENMISDEGYRPSDILKSLSGQTIEVTNTDAEGRLVLSDAMWHVQDTYKPRAMVDIATLTGAALVALGEEYAALFANDDALADTINQVSKETGDKIWRMPLDPVFDRAMDSPVADMKNAASTRYGGSCTGAAFLQRFVQKGVKWAHVDMAPTMSQRADTALCPRGATGYGVRLLAGWVLAA